MSLNRTQMAQTAGDLRANLDRTSLTRDDVTAWLGLAPGELDAILAMSGEASPVTVWLVRDGIEQALREQGQRGEWQVLTDANRLRARQWFALREVPAR